MILPPLNKMENGDDLRTGTDDEVRERQRKDRKCACSNEDHCRHFLTYDLFEVCLALREVHSKRKCLIPVERKSLLFTTTYHDWFMPSFAGWLAVVSAQVQIFQFFFSFFFLLRKGTHIITPCFIQFEFKMKINSASRTLGYPYKC